MRTKLLFLVIFLTLGRNLSAVETDKAAHAAVSYGIAITSAQLCKKWMRAYIPREEQGFSENFFCSLSGGVLSTLGGFVKEAQDGQPDMRDIEANLIGVGLATGLNIVIDF